MRLRGALAHFATLGVGSDGRLRYTLGAVTDPTDLSPKAPPFPPVFRTAIVLELLERMAFYGVYINLGVYLAESARMSDAQVGVLLGGFALARSWLPVLTGAVSDRVGFRKSLVLSFVFYAAAYTALIAFPSKLGAWASVLAIAFAGAFLKPVIPATVRRYSPRGLESKGFSIFYASVNAGSVIGKVAAKLVRTAFSVRASFVNAVVASLLGLGVVLGYFHEPEQEAPADGDAEATGAAQPSFLRSLSLAGSDKRFVAFLAVVAGYYLLIEQFYQTFPTYIQRQIGPDAPREYITLINPLSIALLQLGVARLTRALPPVVAMSSGIALGAVSMALMGLFPSLWGACASFFVFALAEMVYSPRYYEYVSSFAPKGREGMYMGLALVPAGLGGLVGGVLSGRLIEAYLPKGGPTQPLRVWGSYALIGLVCAAAMALFGWWAKPSAAKEST